jgi:formate dehydrogenase maturation protein FdhE
MNPDNNITREQAFAVLARALKLEPASKCNKTFEDISNVSNWATGEIYAMVNAGYIQGANGKLNPQSNISRAEFAQVMYNLMQQYIVKEGEYTETPEGNVMVNVPGVTLKGLTVKGDLIIGDGVGDGNVILDDVIVTGRLVIRGGGKNSIIIRGSSNVSNVIATRVDGAVRVKVEGDAKVETIYVDDGSDDIIIVGSVGSVEVAAGNVTVTATGANIGSANISGSGSALIVDSSSKVDSVSVTATNAEVNVEGSVNNITTSAANTSVTGKGSVNKVEVKQGADGAKIETPKTEITVSEGVSDVTAGGGTKVESGSTVTNNGNGTGVEEPSTGGGGGGGGGGEVTDLVAEALKAVNNASNADNYAAVKTALEENSTKLGLDLTDYNKLTPDGRKNAVANDIYNNKPEGGYTLETLKPMFDEIVATRMVFQESVALFAGASADKPLTDLSYITMLQENLNNATLQKVHSGKSIKEVILPELNGLVTDFNALTTEQKTAVLKTIDYTKNASSTTTRNALRAAITKLVADEEAAVKAALDAVNNASNADNYAAVKTALEENSTKLGLDLTDYNKLTPDGRKNAVANDIYNNKPEGGYTLETLKPMFDEIVATRMVFQESVALFAGASADKPLTDLSYITMLQENLNNATLQKVHSGKSIKEVILPELNGLVTDFNALTTEQKTAVLKTIDYTKNASSTTTRNALRAAITKVVADEEAAVKAALDAVNNASNADNYAAVKTALEENSTKLGLDLTDYNKLTPDGRKNAVANDIYNNKPEGGYTLETLKPMFDEIVATRMVFQESVAKFAAASTENPLTDLSYITMLQENLNAVKLQDKHSGRSIKDDILPELNGLVTDFNNLTAEQKTAVLKTIDYTQSSSSTATRNALGAAIAQVLAEQKA